MIRFTQGFLALGAIVMLLAGCGPTEEELRNQELQESQARVDAARDRYNAAVGNVHRIDQSLSTMAHLQAADPVKMQRLINSCSGGDTSPLEGEEALKIAECVQRSW